MTSQNICQHEVLLYESSSHATEAKFKRSPVAQRAKAATTSKSGEENVLPASFPAPLVLAEDDLAYDPKSPPQSLLSWTRLKERNQVTRRRNIIYLASPPTIGAEVKHMQGWSKPRLEGTIRKPKVEDVKAYLAAFYDGLEVKLLPAKSLAFTSWDDSKDEKIIGLRTQSEVIQVRSRASDDAFTHQLNLNDILDVAIAVLPADAYAILFLVEQDLYEDEDDDFACGRAYGGSRVAVVSSARYNPALDETANVERVHAWPASHCGLYMEGFSTSQEQQSEKSAMRAAVEAYTTKSLTSSSSISGSWLGRVCRTASHELGHCFGIAHCVYYACVMQSTASMQEDVRQPLYLCPVDLAKLQQATGKSNNERHKALLEFCQMYDTVPMFAAFSAWLRYQL
jgi:archaemetzincin